MSISGALLQILEKHWGYTSFRPLQEDIIRSVLGGDDTLGLLPTGGGKSITFQIPALALGGLTIVVTPLISLMKDQVDNLRKRGIKAVFFHSGMTASEYRVAWERLANGRCNLLYLSPERLANKRYCEEFKHLDVKLIVVDEAHCISQWGYDFRPAYLNVGNLRKVLPGIPVLALTATATPKVVADIRQRLGFPESAPTFKKSFSRDNISYIVRHTDAKLAETLHILTHTSGSSIVYVRSRKKTRELADYLEDAGISAAFYHAGLRFDEKEDRQNLWKDGKVRVMVATNAFGMGIDKEDVRVVVHYDFPPSLEEYYQEAGRAGRDGKVAYAVLLANPSDKRIMHRRISNAFPDKAMVRKIYDRVLNFLGIYDGEGYGKLCEFDDRKFCETFDIQPYTCHAALRILSGSGYLDYIEETETRSRVMITEDRNSLYSISGLSAEAETVLRAMLRLYPGLFADYILIDEVKIGVNCGLKEVDVTGSLIELSRARILNYIPRKRTPYIYITTSREPSSQIEIARSAYEDRKQDMTQRAEAMLSYAFSDKKCRVARMLAYFGEEGSDDCGNCDVCRKKRNNGHEEADLRSEVIKLLESNPYGVGVDGFRRAFGNRWSEAWSEAAKLERHGIAVLTDFDTLKLR